MKILFLIKENSGYGSSTPKSGLLESARLTSCQLSEKLGAETKISICIDGNSVDKELSIFKPDICIIEALWVTPVKLSQLVSLHPKVKFVVRVHSEITFLAMEGIAMHWLWQYPGIKNVSIAFNSITTADDLNSICIPAIYLPNIYSDFEKDRCRLFSRSPLRHKVINIGCFGSVRPLKNQLLQAVSAIRFGDEYNKEIRFHINSSRVEQKGDSALKNIRALFAGSKHQLIEYPWLPRPVFLNVVKMMDIGLQVSLSESFNIVSADFVSSGVPIIVSETIDWMPDALKVENDVSEISKKIFKVLGRQAHYSRLSKKYLRNYNYESLKVWERYLKF